MRRLMLRIELWLDARRIKRLMAKCDRLRKEIK